jgi:hypothetical protein
MSDTPHELQDLNNQAITCEPLNEPPNEPLNKPLNKPPNEPPNEPLNEPLNEPPNEPSNDAKPKLQDLNNTDLNNQDDKSPLVDYPMSSVEIAADLIKQLGTCDTHVKKLLNMYRVVSKKLPIATYEKSESEAYAEAFATDISTFSFVNDSEKQIKNVALREYYFKLQLIYIPVFLDAALLYFMRKATDIILFYKLPFDMLEFNLLAEVYQMPVGLAAEFRKFITEGFLRDIRTEEPPFLLTTQLTSAEIINKMPEVAAGFKNILNKLLTHEEMGKFEKNNKTD